jgi:hypothetical protein
VFVTLYDNDLVSEFGEEITIKTDFENLLPKKGDYLTLLELRQAILDAMIALPYFLPVVKDIKIARGK